MAPTPRWTILGRRGSVANFSVTGDRHEIISTSWRLDHVQRPSFRPLGDLAVEEPLKASQVITEHQFYPSQTREMKSNTMPSSAVVAMEPFLT